MSLEVAFAPAEVGARDLAGRTVFVIDILRATTTIAAALHHGARAVIPSASTEEALKLAQTLGRESVRLAGERDCLPIPGFDFGNSPLEMTEERVKGFTLAITTTNGTQALLATQGALAVYAVAAVNLGVSAEVAREAIEAGRPVLIVCAGRGGDFALEDAYCAGRLAEATLGGLRTRKGLNDAALAALDLVRTHKRRWERPLEQSAAGRQLAELGFEADIAAAAQEDAYPVLAAFHDRRITRAART